MSRWRPRAVPVLPAVLAACVAAPAPRPPAPSRPPVTVAREGMPFRFDEGAAARRAADAQCGPRGVRSSPYDRFDPATATWVFPAGCA
jgi:hypothetical protein